MAYDYAPFPYVPPPGLTGAEPRHPVAIVGAGPIGLAMAIDLATRGIASVVLDDNNVVSVGSRAICWAKRTLEIFDRLGVGERMLEKGVTWQVGRLFHADEQVFAFDLLPEAGHKYPAFVNLQQYYVEQYLVERCRDFPDLIDLRFKNKVVGHVDADDHVVLEIDTPDGTYTLQAEYYVACEGARSPTRERMGLPFEGQTFVEQFLIVDVELDHSPFGENAVPERWFWFDPAFHNGKSALLHMQPDNIYRIDLQLDQGADAEEEAREENVLPRLRAILGDIPFRIDWVSVYTFRCMKLDRFVHGRVLFVGDSAHVVSPFGARGGNGGIQDVDNLGWKLAAVLRGEAVPDLLESYNMERTHGSTENIENSSRATNFMTPKSEIEALFRAETLRMAKMHPFARKLINSGRLSRPCSLAGLPLQTGEGPLVGQPLPDAPVKIDGCTRWMVELAQGEFMAIALGDVRIPDLGTLPILKISDAEDRDGLVRARYGWNKLMLVRPDGHVCAEFKAPESSEVAVALRRAMGGADAD